MIKTVFLDMDEVLVDFNKGICAAYNIPYNYEMFSKNYNWFPEIGQTRETINKKCTIDFWRNLEWMHNGKEILQLVCSKFISKQIYLLTTPMPNPESLTGKVLWVQDNLPIFIKHTIITQAPKHLFATPNTLLIDDKDENVEEFVKAGGYGILVNRPWNKGHTRMNHTVEDLEIDLLNIIHETGVK